MILLFNGVASETNVVPKAPRVSELADITYGKSVT
ncbi:hypothetical protein Schulenberg_058 [Escherichia phage Schulenburg]|nr:hypothetical protein Schulenberg_058 [Escherichia phage Schulenburg]